MNIQIFRVEHKSDHRGPYCGRMIKSPRLRVILDSHNCDKDHPTAYQDERLCRITNHNRLAHAFVNLDQLRKWFSPVVLSLLADEGFLVYSYKVSADDVFVGETQVLFRYEKARYRRLMKKLQ